MQKMVRIHIWDRDGLKVTEVDLDEARRLVNETYADAMGGFVVDRKTGRAIGEIDEDVEEILIVTEILGGG